jgi:ribosome-associated protein
MVDYLSRSEKKRVYKQVEELAREVADLSDKELKTFPGGPVIHEEILATRGLKGGSRKRQIKYLAKVLRQGPLDEIYLFITNKKGSQLHSKKQFHAAERMRDTLINEAMENYQECLAEQRVFEPDWDSFYVADAVNLYPNLVESEIRQCIYQYVTTRNKQHYRELFRMMKSAVEQKERLQKG